MFVGQGSDQRSYEVSWKHEVDIRWPKFHRGYVGFPAPLHKNSGFSSLANGSFRLNLWPPRWSIKSQSFLDEKGGQETSSGIFKVCSVSAAFSLSALNVPKELRQTAQNISGFWKWSGRVRIPCTITDTVYYISWESCEIFSCSVHLKRKRHNTPWLGLMVRWCQHSFGHQFFKMSALYLSASGSFVGKVC